MQKAEKQRNLEQRKPKHASDIKAKNSVIWPSIRFDFGAMKMKPAYFATANENAVLLLHKAQSFKCSCQ